MASYNILSYTTTSWTAEFVVLAPTTIVTAEAFLYGTAAETRFNRIRTDARIEIS